MACVYTNVHGRKPKEDIHSCHGLADPFVVLFMVTALEEETEMCVFQARVQRGFIALMGKSLFKVASVSAQTTAQEEVNCEFFPTDTGRQFTGKHGKSCLFFL